MSSKNQAIIKNGIRESIAVKTGILENNELIQKIIIAGEKIIESYRNGGSLYLFGDGGSAADSQHIAAELVNKLYIANRPMLHANALTVNTSILTAIGNDSDFKYVFSRQIESLAKPNDTVLGISTSGNSHNVINGIAAANQANAYTIALTGNDSRELGKIAKLTINVPGTDVARIQESHILVGHLLCEIVERTLYQESKPAVFLDRDGVIVHDDVGYVHKIEDLKFVDGAIEGMRNLQDKYKFIYKLIILTNQAGIAKGKFTPDNYEKFTNHYLTILKGEGVNIDGVYYCPHHPKGTIAEYTKDCYCRKPNPGMLERAIREHNIDVDHSYVIGDKNSDLGLAQHYPTLKAIAVLSGEGTAEEFNKLKRDSIHIVCDNLLVASKLILKETL